MDILKNLQKTTTKSAKRVGRGIGSKKGGHTTGRGAKGDKVRGKTKITFDGTKIKKGWIKRLPYLRGKHRLLPRKTNPVFNFIDIDKWFKVDDIVDVKSLSKKSKIKESDLGKKVKILSKGKLTKALTFKGLLLSSSAKAKITQLGGKIE